MTNKRTISICALAVQATLIASCSSSTSNNHKPDDVAKAYDSVDKIVAGKAISNAKLLPQLLKRGVDLNKPRNIDHTLYANNEADMNAAVTELKQQGFSVDTGTNTDGTFWIDATITQTPNEAASSEFVQKLGAICVRHHCAYDGWGTSTGTK